MVEEVVRDENTAPTYTLSICYKLTEKEQKGSSWTGAHGKFQAGESDAGASCHVNNVTSWSHAVAYFVTILC